LDFKLEVLFSNDKNKKGRVYTQSENIVHSNIIVNGFQLQRTEKDEKNEKEIFKFGLWIFLELLVFDNISRSIFFEFKMDKRLKHLDISWLNIIKEFAFILTSFNSS
jgi:hypothetical protein